MTAITDKTKELPEMETIPSFFEKSCARFPDNTYLREKTDGQYTGMTYRETRVMVYRFAAGLISLGIQPGDRVALMSEGRNAWVISELGVLFAGAINVPISVKLTEPEELKFRISHAGVRMVIVSGQQEPKIRSIKEEMTQMEWIVLLDPPGTGEGKEMLFDQVLNTGRDFLEKHADIFETRWRSVCNTDVANICYTSGTTADPKGIMLTHGNYISNVYQGYSLMDIQENYCTLLILPWDHAFAHTAGIYCFMGRGASVASVQWGKSPQESLRNLPGNIREIKPQILLSVPALADNFKNNIEKGIRERGYVIARLFHLAMKISYWYNRDGYSRGKGGSWIVKPLLSLFARFFFRKIRNHFGGQLEFFVGGGALLDIEFQRFFYALGIPMFQGYGLTEASPIISSNTALHLKLGSSGTLAGNLELKICNEKGEILPVGCHGEIVVKGANVMKGYWKNEEATQAVLCDGWLYTGDLGYLDTEGFLYVLGRYKSLLIANDGEKFSPEGMEESFSGESEFIDQCMLYNNQDPITVMLLVPAVDKIREYLAHLGLDPLSADGRTEALRKIEGELKEYRKGGRFADRFPQRWLPAAIGILENHFTEENHLLNSTLKMVRGRVVEQYRERIGFLFTPVARDILNQRNINAMQTILDPAKKQG